MYLSGKLFIVIYIFFALNNNNFFSLLLSRLNFLGAIALPATTLASQPFIVDAADRLEKVCAISIALSFVVSC